MSAIQSESFDVREIAASIVRHYRRRIAKGDDVALELQNALNLLPEIVPVECPNPHGDPTHPVTRFISDALKPKPGAVMDVIDALRPLSGNLPWRYSYTPRLDQPGLENRMAWAEFVGPEAPIKSGRVCLGVTLIGPRTLYPAHYHPAVESYFVLSGTATWTKAGRAGKFPPGSFILHPSNIIHSMETADDSLLAVYTWTGDLETLSAYEDPVV